MRGCCLECGTGEVACRHHIPWSALSHVQLPNKRHDRVGIQKIPWLVAPYLNPCTRFATNVTSIKIEIHARSERNMLVTYILDGVARALEDVLNKRLKLLVAQIVHVLNGGLC